MHKDLRNWFWNLNTNLINKERIQDIISDPETTSVNKVVYKTDKLIQGSIRTS